MVTAVAAQRTTPVVPVLDVRQPTLGTLPSVLTQIVIDFLKWNNIARSIHRVHQNCRYATRSDGHVDLLGVKYTPDQLLRIFQNYLPNKHHIKTILLDYTRLPGNQVLSALQDMPSLTKLHLRNSSDQGMACLKNYKASLTDLSLGPCNVSDDGLEDLAKTPFSLHFLSLHNTALISNRGIKSISIFSLTYLEIGNCRHITDDALQCLSNCPLSTLKLFNLGKLTDLGMGYLSKHSLTELYLSNCLGISDTGFKDLNKMPLHCFYLNGANISDNGLFSLELPYLTSLHLMDCKHITERGLEGLKRFSLKTLNLGMFSSISDNVMTSLSRLEKSSLSLSYTPITNIQLIALSKLPFSCLSLDYCAFLTPSSAYALLQFSPLTKLQYKFSNTCTASFPRASYFHHERPLGEEIFTSSVSQTVEKIYLTILDYLE